MESGPPCRLICAKPLDDKRLRLPYDPDTGYQNQDDNDYYYDTYGFTN